MYKLSAEFESFKESVRKMDSRTLLLERNFTAKMVAFTKRALIRMPSCPLHGQLDRLTEQELFMSKRLKSAK